MSVPRPISPRMHRRIDLAALPGLLSLALYASRRNRRAAALLGIVAFGEGAALATTDYPPPVVVPWMSFTAHNLQAMAQGACFATAALALPGLSRRDRGVIVAIAAAPFLLAVLSRERPEATALRSR